MIFELKKCKSYLDFGLRKSRTLASQQMQASFYSVQMCLKGLEPPIPRLKVVCDTNFATGT